MLLLKYYKLIRNLRNSKQFVSLPQHGDYIWSKSLTFPILANGTLSVQSVGPETFESFYSFSCLNPHISH